MAGGHSLGPFCWSHYMQIPYILKIDPFIEILPSVNNLPCLYSVRNSFFLQIEITYRISWRMSTSYNYWCNDTTVAGNVQNQGQGQLTCLYNCNSNIMILRRMTYKCTDYNVVEDWSTGLNSVVFDYGIMTNFYIG